MTPARPDLEVLICTIGAEGIRRVAASQRPEIPGVLYLVCWQLPDGDLPVPDELRNRHDTIVIKSASRGISVNRNRALSGCGGEYCLMSDDDVDYSEEGLRELIRFFDRNPQTDIAAVRYTSGGRFVKRYPERVTPLGRMPRGWYISAIEIAFRTDTVKNRVRFNERISIGTEPIICGEEDIFLEDARRAGLTMDFFPVTIGAHDRPSTSDRLAADPRFIFVHGAVMTYTHRRIWPLRLFWHALRSRRLSYFGPAFRGARYALKTKILHTDNNDSSAK